uniref:Uncharacterized protein n=1 Tax=Arundo donax TaxID=35708 RepID=A0A0A9CCU1_ARUDO
MYRRSIGKNK